MPETRVSDIAREGGVSVQSVYRVISRLGEKLEGHVSKRNGVRLVDDAGSAMIREALGHTTVTPISPPVVMPPPDPTPARLESLERSIMLLVDAHGKESTAIRAEVSRLVEENRHLREEVSGLRRLLLPPSPAPQVERVSQAEEMPWYRRLWVEMFEPERLRRCQ